MIHGIKRLPKFMVNEAKFEEIVEDLINGIVRYDTILDRKEKKVQKRKIKSMIRQARLVGGFITMNDFESWILVNHGVWIL